MLTIYDLTFNLSFFSCIKSTDLCHKDQIGFDICEPVCVSQVGLSILRVTFNHVLISSECVKEAHLSYWLSNSSRNNAIDVKLLKNEVWKQDCTLSAINNNHVVSISNHRSNQNVEERNISKNKLSVRTVQNDK